jgi:hypothetical protein
MKLSNTMCTHRDSDACFYLRECAAKENGPLARTVYLGGGSSLLLGTKQKRLAYANRFV